MPTISIKGIEHEYDEAQVITFKEGLIGLPHVRRAAVVAMDGLAPFCWLAPIESDEARFVIVEPGEVFSSYEPAPPPALPANAKTYAIVTVSSDWDRTTFNLRAPIFVDPSTGDAAQHILNDSPYHFAEPLPQN